MSTPSAAFRVELTRLDSRAAATLLVKAVAELNSRYEAHEHNPSVLDPEKFVPPFGAILVAYLDDRPTGCGALRRLEEGVAEVKRMYVEPWARRRGVGRRILAELEAAALRLGYCVIRLETGVRQPEAIQLYEAVGYRGIACYGEFAASPLSVCFEKNLS
jgi:GNAT superfamily N-acetyltransferase